MGIPDLWQVDEKLRHWKSLDEDENFTPVWGFQKEWRLPPSRSTRTGSQTPQLFDPMNPLQYWKNLTEWKSREIAFLDREYDKNPRYWRASFVLLVMLSIPSEKSSKIGWARSETYTPQLRI